MRSGCSSDRSILNSGSALLALSFACPVLVPNLGSLGELQRLVGEEYVRVYSGPISATVLDDALAWLATVPRVRPPDLRHTAWEGIAELTLAAYGTLTGR